MVMLAHAASTDLSDNPAGLVIIGVTVVILFVIILIAAAQEPKKYDVCGLPIKQKYYTWTIQGQKQILCPKCSSQMERKVSKAAFKSKFG
jgi:hypothetical protein